MEKKQLVKFNLILRIEYIMINSYFKDIISTVNESDELYIFGPAETKTKLQQKINGEKSTIASKLKSVETADSMTSNQIIAKVKKFYNQK